MEVPAEELLSQELALNRALLHHVSDGKHRGNNRKRMQEELTMAVVRRIARPAMSHQLVCAGCTKHTYDNVEGRSQELLQNEELVAYVREHAKLRIDRVFPASGVADMHSYVRGACVGRLRPVSFY